MLKGREMRSRWQQGETQSQSPATCPGFGHELASMTVSAGWDLGCFFGCPLDARLNT